MFEIAVKVCCLEYWGGLWLQANYHFWNDFSVADAFGTSAVADTFKRAFEEWKGNYKYLTELVMVLNHKIWQWFEKNAALAAMYNDFWEIADQYALNNLKGEELDYFYRVTD